MSGASPSRRSLSEIASSAGARWVRPIATFVRFTGFWSAIVSPFALLGIVASGLATKQVWLFAAVLLLNLVGLVAGRTHNRD